MCHHVGRRKKAFWSRIISAITALIFLFGVVLPSNLVLAQSWPTTVLNLPIPGTMVTQSEAFVPLIVKGLTIYPENPLEFDFIIDTGHSKLKDDALKQETTKLIKYFLATLTIPEDDVWVNLSPYEKDRIIPENFGLTEMGKDLLAQDYLLKQLTASLMYPEEESGKKFWDRVYEKARALYGTTEIPLNTFNKVWIVPDKATIYEHENNAFIIESHLKVMLEEDYEALEKNMGSEELAMDQLSDEEAKTANAMTSEVVKEILIPEIEKEVNEGKTFANLRQIYNSMILATWYKERLKDSLLAQVYADKSKVKGVDVEDKDIKEKIYNQYLEAFKKGVYDYIKEDYDPATQEIIPRKYFSGGFTTRAADGKTLKSLIMAALITAKLLFSSLSAQAQISQAEISDGEYQKAHVELFELGEEASVDTVEAQEIIAQAYEKISESQYLAKSHPASNPGARSASDQAGLRTMVRGEELKPIQKEARKLSDKLSEIIREVEAILEKIEEGQDQTERARTAAATVNVFSDRLKNLTKNSPVDMLRRSVRTGYTKGVEVAKVDLINGGLNTLSGNLQMLDPLWGGDINETVRAIKGDLASLRKRQGFLAWIQEQSEISEVTIDGNRVLDPTGFFAQFPAAAVGKDAPPDRAMAGQGDGSEDRVVIRSSRSTPDEEAIADTRERLKRPIERGTKWLRITATPQEAHAFHASWIKKEEGYVDTSFNEHRYRIPRNILAKMKAWFKGSMDFERIGYLIADLKEGGIEIFDFEPIGSIAMDPMTFGAGTDQQTTQSSQPSSLFFYDREEIAKAVGVDLDIEENSLAQGRDHLIIQVHSHHETSQYPNGPSKTDQRGVKLKDVVAAGVYSVKTGEGYFYDQKNVGKINQDGAMMGEAGEVARAASPGARKEHPGGIALNAKLLDLQIKRDGNGVPLPLLQQPIGEMRIEGFIPVIINITPAPNLNFLFPQPRVSGRGVGVSNQNKDNRQKTDSDQSRSNLTPAIILGKES